MTGLDSLPAWSQWLLHILGVSPLILVLLIGVALCARHWGEQRKRAVLIGCAVASYALNLTITLIFGQWMVESINARINSISVTLLIIQLVFNLPVAVALLLLYSAAFYGDPPAARHPAINADPEP